MPDLPPIDSAVEAKKITQFISRTFQEAGKTTAIVAVSGGVDSAASLMLAAQALKPESVLALHLPSKTTRPQSTEHAILAMDAAQIPPNNRLTINIGAIIQKSWRIIRRYEESSGDADMIAVDARSRTPAIVAGSRARQTRMSNRQKDLAINYLRLANLTARIRMTLLFDQAKKHNALVIGTENLSEHLLGYFTRFGDEASDLEPIRHLYKTQIYLLAHFLKVPEPIIAKPPSADLWPGQSDSGDLGFTYQEADPILRLIHEKKNLPDSPLAQAVQAAVNRNAFKQQVPYQL